MREPRARAKDCGTFRAILGNNRVARNVFEREPKSYWRCVLRVCFGERAERALFGKRINSFYFLDYLLSLPSRARGSETLSLKQRERESKRSKYARN